VTRGAQSPLSTPAPGAYIRPMSWFNIMAERQIARAIEKGELQNLAGEGAPLPENPHMAFVSPADAAGIRIMAEAGAIPPEITYKKQAAQLRAHLATLTDPAEIKSAQKALADIETQQALAEDARRAFFRP